MKSEATNARSFRFPKSQRLHSKKLIDSLFDQGKSFFIHPFKVLHLVDYSGQNKTNQVLITVSSRKFKRAVDRNLIKRRIREAYRLNKHILEDHVDALPHLLIGYIYVGKDVPIFEQVETKLKQSLQRLKIEYLDK